MTMHAALLRTAARLVPAGQRAEWLGEWLAELDYVERVAPRRATAFCRGSFSDALWLRRHRPPEEPHPARCLALLGGAAAACALIAVLQRDPGMPRGPLAEPLPYMLFQVALAWLVVPVTTSLGLGEYPAHRYGRRWLFLAAKIALLVPLVFFAGLDLVPVAGPVVASYAMLLGFILGFRWALVDQRRRCPQCLRRLSHPAGIGRPAQTFLDWYGTEFACPKGHGLLHVPATPTVSFRTQHWMGLDRSWRGLFS